MTDLLLKLAPISAYETSNELWVIYDLLQAWKLNANLHYGGAAHDRSRELAAQIHEKLAQLDDRQLAASIERMIEYKNPSELC